MARPNDRAPRPGPAPSSPTGRAAAAGGGGAPGLSALRPLRHACISCGACCEGWRIAFVDGAEERRIVAHGAALGVADPVVGGALRMVDGRCAFLDERKRCRIHAAFGGEAKPKVCQQFPKRATLTEDGYRVGLDPACAGTHATWRDAEVIDPLPAMQEERRLPADVAASERGLIGLTLVPGASVARFVAHLVGRPGAGPELEPGFAFRVTKALAIFDLDCQIRDGQFGRDLHARLAHVDPLLRRLDPLRPPTWVGLLSEPLEALALETLRRHLFLRLGDPAVPPFAQALLILCGVIACAWADPSPERFPGALASWARLVRASSFWGRLLPDGEHARWLVTG